MCYTKSGRIQEERSDSGYNPINFFTQEERLESGYNPINFFTQSKVNLTIRIL